MLDLETDWLVKRTVDFTAGYVPKALDDSPILEDCTCLLSLNLPDYGVARSGTVKQDSVSEGVLLTPSTATLKAAELVPDRRFISLFLPKRVALVVYLNYRLLRFCSTSEFKSS